MSEETKPRVMGIETEYALLSGKLDEATEKMPELLLDSEFNTEFFLALFPRQFTHGKTQFIKDFLLNGAKMHIDTGSHPEYATPECQSVSSLIIYDKAGQRMMENAEVTLNECIKNKSLPSNCVPDSYFKKQFDKHKFWLDKRFYPIRIYRNNLSPYPAIAGVNNLEKASWGFHENYMMDNRLSINDIEKALLPFFISRQIFGGSGWLSVNESDLNVSLLFAQRPLVTQFRQNGSTTSGRPILNTKQESLAEEEKYKRLHLIMGDSNMSPWAGWLKIKTTAMLLDLVEDHFITPDLSITEEHKPVKLFKDISRDTNFLDSFTIGQMRHTALSLQYFYLEMAQRYYLVDQRKEADEETKIALELWQTVLDALKKQEYDALAPYFDYFAKLYLFNTILSDYGLVLNNKSERKLIFGRDIKNELFYRLKELDIKYHRANEKEGIYFIFQRSDVCQKLRKHLANRIKFLQNDFVNSDNLSRAALNPPPGRAMWRKKFLEFAQKESERALVRNSIADWCSCYISYEGGVLKDIKFINKDPYCEMTPELKCVLDSEVA